MPERERPYEKDLQELAGASRDVFDKRVKFANSKPEVFFEEGRDGYIKSLEAIWDIIEKAGLFQWRIIARARGEDKKLPNSIMARLDGFIVDEIDFTPKLECK